MSEKIRQLALEAEHVQDACNMCGLSKRFAQVVQELSDELRRLGLYQGTDQINRHPITQAWASKIHDLAGPLCDQFDLTALQLTL